jgi:pyruvate/2-oxoglutarate dehydrogenase complex dihydrolipoamide dehydrogenase (E3) component
MESKISCDVAIIGAGSAGLSLAAGAAQLGVKVVLIEADKMGGDCLNYGCVPSKSLLAAAKKVKDIDVAGYFGIEVGELHINFPRVLEHVHEVIKSLYHHDSVERFEGLGVSVIKGQAQFKHKGSLEVGGQTIQAKRFVIASGSKPAIPPIPGLKDAPFLTNETIFNLSTQPKHLVVIGGGPIGCELAQAFALLKSKVTIIEAATILPKDEADCVDVVRQSLKHAGVEIHESSQVERVVYDESKGWTVSFKQQGKNRDVHATHVLVATGRQANLDGLALEKAGVDYTAKGIKVNKSLRTSNKKIYAMGDVIGAYQFTHVAGYHAGIVLRNILFKLPAKVEYDAVPWVTYTMPELAHVGQLSTHNKKHAETVISEWPYADVDRAQTDHVPEGKIKIITDKKGLILGVTIVGASAGELILPWVMAVREKKTLRSFTDTIVPYPTLSDISKRAAGLFYQPKLFSKPVKKIVKWLMWFTR